MTGCGTCRSATSCWAACSTAPADRWTASARCAGSGTAPLHSRPINPLERAPIKETLDVGVRAINAC